MNPTSLSATFLLLASVASAQSEINGINVRLNEAFVSSTDDFVTDYLPLDPTSANVYGLDWDTAGTTLWGVDDATLEVVTIDPALGSLTGTGVFIAGTGLTGLTGLTADPDGVTWWLSDYNGADSTLFRGDIATGVFTFVGTIATANIIIDIAMDSNGDLYGHSISDDSLYSVDKTTGAGTVIGPTGFAANFAQGMDFEPATDILYATIYTGGGTGSLCTIDLTTGVATQIVDTFPLNAEMEIAIRPGGGPSIIGTPYCMANPNSTGQTGLMTALGSEVVTDNDVTLVTEQLPNNSFGFFVASPMQGFVANPAGSAGNLCLGGAIGRYVGPGQIQSTGSTGGFSLAIDLMTVPTPSGPTAIAAGQAYNFQAWHRDSDMGSPTSNFTNGLSIMFL